ncbi:hypothetical protein LGN17_05250 [Burkholderia sp. AU30280]|uniref:hypothetical protein n=1 Tax=Burkholderia sp. AU30280 TaxID=2879628 RepID=UPI001CF2BF8F|nr:hypothetical protein [Burkholderia sp. AU30280]MCA8271928.1 hypothetical protein [Burkholderia sp. AU30280]
MKNVSVCPSLMAHATIPPGNSMASRMAGQFARVRLLVSTNAGHAKQLKLDVRFTDSFVPLRAAAMNF